MLYWNKTKNWIMTSYVCKKMPSTWLSFTFAINTSMDSTNCDLLYFIPMAVVKPMHDRVTYRL